MFNNFFNKNYFMNFFFVKTINNLCEVAIQVKQKDSTVQIWDIEKFEYKFNEMKEIYQKWKTSEKPVRNIFFGK